jgi:magnesium transporter
MDAARARSTMTVIDNAIYVEGRRVASPTKLDQTFEALRDLGGTAWLGLREPSPAELGVVATEFGLHDLAVEDALKGQQRSKLETFGDTMAIVVRSARYHDETETVGFSDVHVFVGANYVVTVCQAASPNLAVVRRRLEGIPSLLAMGPLAILYGILDEIVDGYLPVVAGLENDIDEIEDEIFGERASVSLSQRIYELHREVIGFQRAVHPLAAVLGDLGEGASRQGADVELTRRLRDVHDHVLRVDDRIDGFRSLLDNALRAHSTIVAQQQTEASFAQNEEIKQISAWAAILFAPSLIGTVYGMNFHHIPELSWVWGYPFALGLMVALSGGLFAVFKRLRWL